MSKKQWLIIFGVVLAALPFLGFPSAWDTIFGIVLGFLVIVTAYSLPGNKSGIDGDSLPFAEHKNGIAHPNPSGRSAGEPADNINSQQSSN